MNQKKSRTENAVLNTIWAMSSQVLIVILGLLSRKIFLNYLGAELLGVNSLFSDVLMLFSFADLGFGTAIMFSMYKPIAQEDTKRVSSLLLFYKTIYRFVIAVLIVISLCFLPFLRYIKTAIPFSDLTIYYFFFQLTNIIEYVWAYRESYVIACQRERELTIINLIYSLAKNLAQIIIVICFKGFILYLTTGLLCVIVKKVIANLYITRKYPITRLVGAEALEKTEKSAVVKKSSALVVTKIGNLLINQTDSLIVSYMISVAQWGLVSNYLVIKKSVFTVSDKIFSAVLPSMGNLIAEDNKERETAAFLKYDFYNAWLCTFCFIALACLSSPFVSLFFGEKAILPNVFVFIFFFSSFVDSLRAPVSVMREAGGTFEKDKWYTILAAIINILFSIPLAYFYGLSGVYIGTICAMLVLHVSRTMVLLKAGTYFITTKGYLLRLLRHTAVGLTLFAVTFIAVLQLDHIAHNAYIAFFLKCLLVCIIPNGMWMIIYRNNQNMETVNKAVKTIRARFTWL